VFRASGSTIKSTTLGARLEKGWEMPDAALKSCQSPASPALSRINSSSLGKQISVFFSNRIVVFWVFFKLEYYFVTYIWFWVFPTIFELHSTLQNNDDIQKIQVAVIWKWSLGQSSI
jgi:hypothetical protein